LIEDSKDEHPQARPRKLRGAATAAPRPLPDPPRRLLLASTGAPFSKQAIAKAIELATPEHAKITVLSIAHVYGTSLGIPHPGLQPTRAEWQAQRDQVEDAAEVLRRKGFEVRVQVARSRNAPKMISRWGIAKHVHAIVVADPERPAWRRFIEGDAAHEIFRRCHIPVHVVPVPAVSHRTARANQQRR
jgi:nucleotide-binding universal stress UspA family protein